MVNILDFGSGEGITADHFAKDNTVVAIEPWDEMLKNAWTDNSYRQIIGDATALSEFSDDAFDVIICHNVLEYIDDTPTASVGSLLQYVTAAIYFLTELMR